MCIRDRSAICALSPLRPWSCLLWLPLAGSRLHTELLGEPSVIGVVISLTPMLNIVIRNFRLDLRDEWRQPGVVGHGAVRIPVDLDRRCNPARLMPRIEVRQCSPDGFAIIRIRPQVVVDLPVSYT